jgi:site-specific DNA-cytosine methylase
MANTCHQAMLATMLASRPAFGVFENVTGILRHMDDLKSSMAVLKDYHILWRRICPTDLGHAVRRPRIYFLALRKDVAIVDDPESLCELGASVWEKMKRSLQAPLQDRLLAESHPWVQRHLGTKRSHRTSNESTESTLQKLKLKGTKSTATKSMKAKATKSLKATKSNAPKSKPTPAKWQSRHQAMRSQLASRKEPCPVMTAGLTLSPRESDVLALAWQKHGIKDMVVDVSQNADRVPLAFDGMCPTVTPAGKCVSLAVGRDFCPEEKLLLHGFPVHSLQWSDKLSPAHLSSLAGNCMHVEAVAAATLVALSLLSIRRLNDRPAARMPQRESCFLNMGRPSAKSGSRKAKSSKSGASKTISPKGPSTKRKSQRPVRKVEVLKKKRSSKDRQV